MRRRPLPVQALVPNHALACKATRTRVRGLATWHPQRATLELLRKVQDVLGDYREYLPLTIRQVFYRLVGVHDYAKTERAYVNLAEMISRARRSGRIRFDAIRDDGTTLRTPPMWLDARDMVNAFARSAAAFRLDRQIGQPRRLLIAVEAQGMVPMVEAIAHDYGISVHSSGGFDSLTAKRDLANLLGRYHRSEVLHIGDHDPSGVHLFTSLAEDVKAIAADMGHGGNIQFTRLAVTPQQIAALDLPTAPAKVTDRRAFIGETVQVEAIPPDIFVAIVREAITERLDWTAYDAVLAREQVTRRDLGTGLKPLVTKWGELRRRPLPSQ